MSETDKDRRRVAVRLAGGRGYDIEIGAGLLSELGAVARARLFAEGLREHFRSRHGRRWVASRAAGGELIDVWNTASRSRVEELARLLWGGDLSFDLLADASLAALEGDEGA